MKLLKILIILNSFIYSNFLKSFRITFPLPGIVTNTCRIEGTAEPNETIRVFIGKEEKRKEMQEIERVVADKDGKWICCPKFPLNETDFKFKDTITVYNSKNQSIQQEISIEVKPVELKFINNTKLNLHVLFIERSNNFLTYCDSFLPEIIFKVYHVDERFFLEWNHLAIKYIKKLVFDTYSKGVTDDRIVVTISELLKPYLEYKKVFLDYHENKKNKLIECLNHTIPVDLINIVDDYVYVDENDDFAAKFETIKYHIIFANDKYYNLKLKEIDSNELKKKKS